MGCYDLQPLTHPKRAFRDCIRISPRYFSYVYGPTDKFAFILKSSCTQMQKVWKMAGRKPGVIALFDVDGTLTAPRKVLSFTNFGISNNSFVLIVILFSAHTKLHILSFFCLFTYLLLHMQTCTYMIAYVSAYMSLCVGPPTWEKDFYAWSILLLQRSLRLRTSVSIYIHSIHIE